MALKAKLVEIFKNAGAAHSKAYERVNGEDADWPIWYAQHSQSALSGALNREFTVSELVYCLMQVEFDRQVANPKADWPPLYADHFIERFAAPAKAGDDLLELYLSRYCPYCRYVEEAIEEIGVEVKRRDVSQNRAGYDELIKARGRGTVPVLKITSPDGTTRWMPEARDIVAYLRAHYGGGDA
jgi:glutaredoxin